jgi:hypothetical protein
MIKQQQLDKLLTVEELSKLDGFPTIRHLWDWVGKKGLKVKQGKEWVRYQLPTVRSKSEVQINPEDLVKFLKKTGKERLIIEIPTFKR